MESDSLTCGLVTELVKQQASDRPLATAVICGQETLTYGQLDNQANQLARFLRSHGVGPETRVAVFLERDLDLPITFLAVLKAGGAYVPLEPSLPAKRLAYILDDCGATLVITQRELAPKIASPTRLIIDLDANKSSIEALPKEALPNLVHPRNIAYTLYTSGSTGQPKGVVISHAALWNHLRGKQNQYPLLSTDRFLQKTPVVFDDSIYEYWATLTSGAAIVLVEHDAHRYPDDVVTAIQEHGVTILQGVPTFFLLLLTESRFNACRSLRRLCVGGEEFPSQLLVKLRETLPWCEIFNTYGPTEATVDVSYWRGTTGPVPARLPIGQAIGGVSLYVLDHCLRPVSQGQSGELCIGGPTVARGYWNRPDLTAERFVPDPFGDTPGGRLYRTGDVARWLDQENLEYLGRADSQVKIRGFRIELGEIESTLLSYQGITDAAVTVQEFGDREKRLIAYFVLSSQSSETSLGGSVLTESLKAHLAQSLPEYMVPSVLIRLDAMPLSPAGKIDRQALPSPISLNSNRRPA